MSLTNEDLYNTSQIVDSVIERKLEPISGEIKALGNDVKEIYSMITKLEKSVTALAKKNGLVLPR